ncbi:hypothetical protein D3C86_1468620 [compost metagenome]
MTAGITMLMFQALNSAQQSRKRFDDWDRSSSPKRRPYIASSSRPLASSMESPGLYRPPPSSRLLNILDYVPHKGDPSGHVDGFEAMDINGTHWKTVEGRWILDHLYYRHNL